VDLPFKQRRKFVDPYLMHGFEVVQMLQNNGNAIPGTEPDPTCTDNSTLTFDDLYMEWIVSMIISILCSVFVLYIIFALSFFTWKKKSSESSSTGKPRNLFACLFVVVISFLIVIAIYF